MAKWLLRLSVFLYVAYWVAYFYAVMGLISGEEPSLTGWILHKLWFTSFFLCAPFAWAAIYVQRRNHSKGESN